ncbi:PAS domain-containing protein, partial [bacterium AH-315-C07]|nr:PAS domain-containing protein [bacterium AH-315-C07]
IMALQQSKLIKDPQAIPYVQHNLGDYYFEVKEYDKAEEHFKKSSQYSKSIKDSTVLMHFNMHFADLAYLNKDYKIVLNLCHQSINYYQKYKETDDLKKCLGYLIKSYQQLSDYKNAFKYQHMLTNYKDSVNAVANHSLTIALQTEFELSNKEREIERLQIEQEKNTISINRKNMQMKRNRMYNYAMYGGIAMLVLLLYGLYSRYRFKKETSDQLAEKNAQIELQKKKLVIANIELEKLSMVAKETDNYVIITNNKDRIEWVNEGFTRITGYSLDEIKGKLPSEVLRTGGEDPEVVNRIDDRAHSLVPFTDEILNYKKNGEPVWLILNVNPILDKKGKLLNYICVGSDITKIKNSEEQIKEQHIQILKQNKRTKQSINYAQRIQETIMPAARNLKKLFPESFIYFKAKDVISGDFPWIFENKDHSYVAAVDCTGHGVPGAFMSIIGYFLLNDVVRKNPEYSAADILLELHDGIKLTLNQTENEDSHDGMDIALCKINKNKRTFEYAGAHRPLVYSSNSELKVIKGDRFPIGGTQYSRRGKKIEFKNHFIKAEKGDSIFIYSDGMSDQLGGPAERPRPFANSRIYQIIEDDLNSPMEAMNSSFQNKFEAWLTNDSQLDDVLLIGLRLS